MTAIFNVAARRLILTWDRDIQLSAPLDAANLTVVRTDQSYPWAATVSVLGPVLTADFAPPVLLEVPDGTYYAATPPVVRSLFGTPAAPFSAFSTTFI